MSKKLNKNLIKTLIVITTVNLLILIIGYIIGLFGHKSFNVSLAPVTLNINIFCLLILVIYLINIKQMIKTLKRIEQDFNTKKVRISIIVSILIITISLFLPVRYSASITYEENGTYITNNDHNDDTNDNDSYDNDIRSLFNNYPIPMTRTIHTSEYKNLYNITLYKDIDITDGQILF